MRRAPVALRFVEALAADQLHRLVAPTDQTSVRDNSGSIQEVSDVTSDRDHSWREARFIFACQEVRPTRTEQRSMMSRHVKYVARYICVAIFNELSFYGDLGSMVEALEFKDLIFQCGVNGLARQRYHRYRMT